MDLSKRDFLLLAPAAALAATPAVAMNAGSANAGVMVAYDRWKTLHTAWKAARDPVDEFESRVFAEARRRFGDDSDDRTETEQRAYEEWIRKEEAAAGKDRLEEEANARLTVEADALIAFYETPADTVDGVLLKARVADQQDDGDYAFPGIFADLERLAGGAS